MTLNNMSGLLGDYLNDIKEKNFVSGVKIVLLNTAQDRLLTLIDRSLITDLDLTVTAQALSSTDGSFDLSGLTKKVYNGVQGIDGIRLTGGEFSGKITFEEYKYLSNKGRTFQTDDPKHYFRGVYVFVNPYIGQTIDIYYRQVPTQMVFGTSNTECGLNSCFHEIIVGLACESYVDLSPVAARAYQNAISKIQTMNSNNIPSESNENSKIYNQVYSSNSNANFLSR